MRHKLTVLAVATLLVLGTGGVVAATLDDPTTDASETALLDEYTVEVVDPDDRLSDEDVDRAVETAWATAEVRSYFEDGESIHVEVWISQLDDRPVFVKLAPIDDPDTTRVIAEVDLAHRSVTKIREPITLNVSSARTIDTGRINLVSGDRIGDSATDENATRITADQAVRLQLNESSIDAEGDGPFVLTADRNTPKPSER